MKTMLFRLATLALASSTMFLIHCSDEIDEAINCSQICDRYKDCYDEDYNTGDCKSRCRNKSKDDPDFSNKADRCESCLDNNESCASQTFSCTAECADVVVF